MGRISARLINEFSRQQLTLSDELEEDVMSLSGESPDDLPTADALLEDGYDPLHVRYILGHQFTAMFSEAVSEFDEFSEFIDIALDIEDKYVPDPDEMTPVTGSFNSLWTLFDCRFGKDQETVGTCLTDVLKAIEAEASMIQTLQHLADSRMGIYRHCGMAGDYIELRELITGRSLRCHSSSGYTGHQNELWFVRLGPPFDTSADYHVTLTTPYVLMKTTPEDWSAFLRKSMLGSPSAVPRSLHDLLKYGLSRTSWHDYIVQAFHHSEENAVFLEGIPDVAASMPHAGRHTLLAARPAPTGQLLASTPVALSLTQAQRRKLVQLLPELSDQIDVSSKRSCLITVERSQLQRAAQRAQETLPDVKGIQRKPLERLMQLAELDQLRASGQVVYQLRVELNDTDPPVWRQILLEECTFDHLHLAIQAAMGWGNSHLYEIDVAGCQLAYIDEEIAIPDGRIRDSADTLLSELIPLGASRFKMDYMYDFGDSWQHTIIVEEIRQKDDTARYPCCVAGARACPPEDCGGAYEYYLLLTYLDLPDDEREEPLSCLPDDFDAGAFEAEAATRRMRRWLR